MKTWNNPKIVAFDFETSGELPEYALQPWRYSESPLPGCSWITSVSLIRHDGKALVPHGSKLFPTKADLRAMCEEIVAQGWTVVGWNIAFDISYLIAAGLGDMCHKIKWLDAMLLWRHLEIEPEYEFQSQQAKKKRYRLKPEGIDRFLPMMAGYNDDIDFHATDAASLAKLQTYNDRDSVCTWIIGAILWEDLTERQRECAVVEAECLSLLAEANLKGMVVDTLAANELAAWLADTAAGQLAKLAEHGVTEKIVRSPLQMAKLLFDDWGLPVLKENTSKLTGKTSRSTDKEVLHELAFIDPRCRELKLYREALNNRTKFADAPLASVDYNGDGRTHPSAICFGTYSGRLTYASSQGANKDKRQTGFALHQEKREAVFREIIIADPGCDLLEFDASGQEYRWMAVASGDTTMLQLCLPGEDPHSFMGARIAHRDYHELMVEAAKDNPDPGAKGARQLGKVGNLSLQYRTSARKLRSVARVQYDIPLELPEAQRIHKTYQQTYPGVPRYWNEQILLTKRHGYVETLAGRRVQVVGNWDGDWGWSMGSTAINYRIQGTGADQKYLALKVIKPYLTSIGGRFGWDLHDGIYMHVPRGRTAEALPTIKHMLDNLPYQEAWGFTPPIPMPWDAKVGPSWGGLRKVEF